MKKAITLLPLQKFSTQTIKHHEQRLNYKLEYFQDYVGGELTSSPRHTSPGSMVVTSTDILDFFILTLKSWFSKNCSPFDNLLTTESLLLSYVPLFISTHFSDMNLEQP